MRGRFPGSTLISIAVILVVASILIIPFFRPSLGMYITIAAFGFALALQKYVASFAGYFVLRLSNVFSVGDRIRMAQLGIKGDVRRIGLLHFTLDEVGEGDKSGGELTGRVLHIPNHVILDQPVLNFSQDFTSDGRFISCEYVFDEVRIPLPVDIGVSKARTILDRILVREDQVFVEKAKEVFGNNSPNFLHEAAMSPRVRVYVDNERPWLVGRVVAPVRVRNELKSEIVIQFMQAVEADKAGVVAGVQP